MLDAYGLLSEEGHPVKLNIDMYDRFENLNHRFDIRYHPRKELSYLCVMKDIFERLKAGKLIRLEDPEFFEVDEVVNRALSLAPALNAATSVDEIREKLSEIIGTTLIHPGLNDCLMNG